MRCRWSQVQKPQKLTGRKHGSFCWLSTTLMLDIDETPCCDCATCIMHQVLLICAQDAAAETHML